MSGNDWAIWSGAIVASLLLHGLLLLNSGSLAGNSEKLKQKRHTTRVSFRSVAALQTAPLPSQPMPEKPPEREVTESAEAPPQPEPPKQEERTQKAHQPEPKTKPVTKQEVTPPVPTSSEAEKSPAAAEVMPGSVDDPAFIEQAKQEYLRRLMAHIESYKHYPRAARRRGIEGEVRIRFTLHQAGRMSALVVDGEQRVLVSAARDAVEAAEPMPLPPDSMPLPWDVSFTMRFTLR